MPPGADSILIQENAAVDGDRLTASADPLPAGRHVRRHASDFARGAPLLRRGSRLGPAQIALAVLGGRGDLPVGRRPRVALLSTGNELVPPGAPTPIAGALDAGPAATPTTPARALDGAAAAAVTPPPPPDAAATAVAAVAAPNTPPPAADAASEGGGIRRFLGALGSVVGGVATAAVGLAAVASGGGTRATGGDASPRPSEETEWPPYPDDVLVAQVVRTVTSCVVDAIETPVWPLTSTTSACVCTTTRLAPVTDTSCRAESIVTPVCPSISTVVPYDTMSTLAPAALSTTRLDPLTDTSFDTDDTDTPVWPSTATASSAAAIDTRLAPVTVTSFDTELSSTPDAPFTSTTDDDDTRDSWLAAVTVTS